MHGPYLGDLFSKVSYHSVSNDMKLMSKRRYKEQWVAQLSFTSHRGAE